MYESGEPLTPSMAGCQQQVESDMALLRDLEREDERYREEALAREFPADLGAEMEAG